MSLKTDYFITFKFPEMTLKRLLIKFEPFNFLAGFLTGLFPLYYILSWWFVIWQKSGTPYPEQFNYFKNTFLFGLFTGELGDRSWIMFILLIIGLTAALFLFLSVAGTFVSEKTFPDAHEKRKLTGRVIVFIINFANVWWFMWFLM